MNKSILTLTLLLSVSLLKVKAQTHHELRVGYSESIWLKTGDIIADGIADAITAGLSGAKIKDARSKAFGAFEIGYRYQLTNKLKAGGDIYFLRTDKTFQMESKNTQTSSTSTRRTNYIMVLPMAEFSYVKSSLLNFYGSAGAGAIFSYTKEVAGGARYESNNASFAFQINPVGLSVGKRLAGYLELGFGYKGIVTAGLSYKF